MKNNISHLLFTNDFVKAKEEIKQLNGHITVQQDNIFSVNLPAEVKIENLKYASTYQPNKLNDTSSGPIDKGQHSKKDKNKIEEQFMVAKSIQVEGALPAVNAVYKKMTGKIVCRYFIVQGPAIYLQFT